METSNQQGAKSTTGITYTQYVKELEQNKLDLLTNCVIEEMGGRYWDATYTRKHVSSAMVHYALMEADPELYPTSNYYAYAQYEYGKISFPVDTRFFVCEAGYSAVTRIINRLLHKTPAYVSRLKKWVKEKEAPQQRTNVQIHSKCLKLSATSHIAADLLTATSLNCVIDYNFSLGQKAFQAAHTLLLQQELILN